jgi:GTPase Era involved in 16S rRNA processing
MVQSKSIAALSRFFPVPSDKLPKKAKEALVPIEAFDWNLTLTRAERQVVFFGAFKAGKSTILNAVIGSPLLPSRANRATGVITRIKYGTEQAATVVLRTPQNIIWIVDISFDDIARYILLDTSQGDSRKMEGVEEVSIQTPVEIIKNRCTLVDTPGLMDNEELTERSFQELERADLAVMVLSADKLLSSREKEAAQRVNEMLNGNIVFIVNRVNLVDSEDRNEIIEHARHVLSAMGNSIVGQPRVFVMGEEVLAHRRSNGNGSKVTPPGSRKGKGLKEFKSWMENLLGSPEGERMILLSRLGLLHDHVRKAKEVFDHQLKQANTKLQSESARAEATHREKLSKFDAEMREGALRLSTFKSKLGTYGEEYVKDCEQRAQRLINTDSNWSTKLRSCFDDSVKAYTSKVQKGLEREMTSFKIQTPAFSIGDESTSVEATTDNSVKAGAAIGAIVGMFFTFGLDGGLFGAAAGAWLSRKLFGVDVKAETLSKVRQAARAMLSTLSSEAEKYVGRCEKSLKSHAKKQRPKLQLTSAGAASAEEVERYDELAKWSGELSSAIRKAEKELSS